MRITETEIPGLLVIEPAVHSDSRGYFMETWTARDSELIAPGTRWVQDNESCSTRGVLRGLHFQCPPHAQAKLVRCVTGRVLDIVVDIRRGSPTYGRHAAIELSGENHRQVYMPRGLAHGFAVLSDRAIFQYKCDNVYAPASEGGISILDPALGLTLPFDAAEAIMSAKDMQLPRLAGFKTPFFYQP